MSSLIQFPFTRNAYAAIDNPLYIQDITAANQGVLDALTAIAGLGSSDFAIFSGFVFTEPISGPNFYTPGICYINGTWYYQPDEIEEGQFLQANITGIMPYTFTDSVERPEYDVNYTQAGNSGISPIFSGSMDQYRLDLKTSKSDIVILQIATILENVQVATLPSSYVVNFTNDKAIFFVAAIVNATITFDLTNAVPGTVVSLNWTFTSTETLTITGGAGQTILKESGDLSLAANNVNLLTIIFVGIDASGNGQIRYVLSQPV